MSNVLAAIGVGQMEVLDSRVNRRREICDLYQNILGEYEEIHFMPEIYESKSNRWLTTLTFDKTNPQDVICLLEEANIESRPLWKPMHMQPLFCDALAIEDGTSQALFKQGICLPSGSSMSDADVIRVCDMIKKAIQ
jgi:UDP-N-acetylbacillosamine transaminase